MILHPEPLFNKLSAIGGADRDRTDDLRLAKPALSQLSYSPDWPDLMRTEAGCKIVKRAELIGIEPTTSGLQNRRSPN